MVQVTLLFQKTRASIGSIELDCSLAETHAHEIEVTDHPVESGANISDHARSKPIMLTLDGMISNTPLPEESQRLTHIQEGEVDFLSRSGFFFERAGEAYSKLLRLKDTHEIITVATSLASYDNMVLTSLSIPRDSSTGQVLRFTATLKEVKQASTQFVIVEEKAQAKANAGKVVTQPIEEEKESTIYKGVQPKAAVFKETLQKGKNFIQGAIKALTGG